MNAAAPVFALLALILTGPAPELLARAAWPSRAPRAALVLWQAVALAAVLAAFGSGLAVASELLVPGPNGHPTTSPADEINALGLPLWIIYVTVLTLTLLVGARLCWAIVRVSVRTRRRRAQHRMIVDLVGTEPTAHGHHRRLTGRSRSQVADLRVIDTAEPVAYCLPGLRQRVVLSEGTFASLDDTEITAILSHERCHLRSRHDLLLEAFTAVHEAFPRFVRSESALGSVRLLVELLADDSAVKVTGRKPLARALIACANSTAPQGALAAGGQHTVLRVQRLTGPLADTRVAVAAYLASVAILLVPTIAVAVPWLIELDRLLNT
ncbi:MAG: M56 family metallopeptidase [Mycobacteriaceae bacterium]|nr:M56 family metallopeptidase [Mycobacteriaceae bacterium]